MKHVLFLLTILFLAVSVMAGGAAQGVIEALPQGISNLQGTASAISDAIAFAQSHPVVSTVIGGWAAHSEAAPFVKKWKHDGTLQLGWRIIQAILGVLAKPKG
jgi:hypothetical protein